MARRRSRRRKSSYEQTTSGEASAAVAADDLSPRARRLVEGGVIDIATITGTGAGGKVTSGDILHAARVMEMEQSVARIEAPNQTTPVQPLADPDIATPESPESPQLADQGLEESDTSTAVAVGGEPISVEATPWEDYNGSTEGLSEIARPGADQSWGEAEAHLAAMAETDQPTESLAPEPSDGPVAQPEVGSEQAVSEQPAVMAELPASEVISADGEEVPPVEHSDVVEAASVEAEADAGTQLHREVMMDFGTLELVDPESVWAEGAEDFAPWFLAHSQQLGDVLGLSAGLTDARQFTTKSATGVLGRDDNGEDVVVVSSKSATADDSDLGHALGMAASSGAGSVALVSAAIHDDQLKALAWLNNQTKSGVKWYGIEMRVVRIADSPAAMLFDLVAAPPH